MCFRDLISGADEYITKPFSPRILVARINAVLRRTSDGDGEDGEDRRWPGSVLNQKRPYVVTIDGKEIALSVNGV